MSIAGSRFRTYRPRPSPALRLVCFPHAGGAASFYRGWAEHLPDDIELAIAMYPGRENRLPDPHPDTLEGLAADFAASMPQGVPLVLLGHSMGAAVALEVARRMSRPPARLIVSGHPAPHRQRPNDVHLRPDDGLLAELRTVGGTTAGLLDYPEIRKLVLPMIRADYRLIERYRCGPPVPLAIPITALIGRADPEVDENEARAWESWTLSGFELHTVDGGHFHLVEYQREFVEWLTTLLTNADPRVLPGRKA
ncbi:thioesterase II family protein [Micromonospora andamanensis]|uniref:Pyochelin biosynthetic protein n=1 Tax=Micromonospora andamanensis TaxID=1287068 RepID=A0ABQ4HZP6_9ACTN|nr:alpha/beta fold hydrolase [Micromonospora andamanensis]GIJ11090.1 pyochelin biosynthetic protein [Micromonospora andamanensis]